MSESPSFANVRRRNGVAGQYEIAADVTYPGESSQRIRFVGSTYGGPIIMATPDGHQIPISSRVTDRIGDTLTADWVRAFFGPRT